MFSGGVSLFCCYCESDEKDISEDVKPEQKVKSFPVWTEATAAHGRSLSSRHGRCGAAGRDDGVQEDPDQTRPGDGRGHDGVPAEGREAHRAGDHGDPAGGVDAHGRQDGWSL